ncbi:outer membrane transport energization protein ExbD [Litorimonas taeanensis]|uniref:Outer membrane transport energization protein ExbD n=1 Tax=Litorimonas taeanensis TaxID=568099 RepID=A0A420WIN8_9PROT|nr:biopolymer transporter ExbD [Litorimonas taeanensis]RKQ70880.1 outer membrane transport energization protein ExbD [Litorimonas taeanensis]
MARRSRVKLPEEDTELNMTPMLDVVFILLIFFIVTSVFVKTPGIDPVEPVANTDVEWKPTILVAINATNEVWIDKRPYSLEEIRPVITGIRDESPKAVAIIKADRDAEVGTVMAVQELMQELSIDARVGTE